MRTFGILVGGGPAPGINGVIGAATIIARRHGARVLGIEDGFHSLMNDARPRVRELEIPDISRVHLLGGSILRTSRANPARDPVTLERVVNSLEAIGIGDLVTIGGDDTCHSAREVARASRGRINVVHVPKTIDNDLPLPPGVPTFGFETARAEATRILSHLMEDARTTGRWYVAVLMGRSAGHLALGAARAAGTTIALVAEEFPSGDIELADITRQLEGAAIKRLAMGRNYGVAVLAEGIGERLNIATLPNGENIPRDEHGHLRLAEVPLGALVARKMSSSLAELGVQATVVAKDLGYELRCAPPNAYDIAYSRELGAGAIITLLDGGSEVMITRQGEDIVPVPLSMFSIGRPGVPRFACSTFPAHRCALRSRWRSA